MGAFAKWLFESIDANSTKDEERFTNEALGINPTAKENWGDAGRVGAGLAEDVAVDWLLGLGLGKVAEQAAKTKNTVKRAGNAKKVLDIVLDKKALDTIADIAEKEAKAGKISKAQGLTGVSRSAEKLAEDLKKGIDLDDKFVNSDYIKFLEKTFDDNKHALDMNNLPKTDKLEPSRFLYWEPAKKELVEPGIYKPNPDFEENPFRKGGRLREQLGDYVTDYNDYERWWDKHMKFSQSPEITIKKPVHKETPATFYFSEEKLIPVKTLQETFFKNRGLAVSAKNDLLDIKDLPLMKEHSKMKSFLDEALDNSPDLDVEKIKNSASVIGVTAPAAKDIVNAGAKSKIASPNEYKRLIDVSLNTDKVDIYRAARTFDAYFNPPEEIAVSFAPLLADESLMSEYEQLRDNLAKANEEEINTFRSEVGGLSASDQQLYYDNMFYNNENNVLLKENREEAEQNLLEFMTSPKVQRALSGIPQDVLKTVVLSKMAADGFNTIEDVIEAVYLMGDSVTEGE